MKKLYFLTIICFLSLNAIGQDFTELKKKEDFKPAEPTVLELSNYLLDNPIDEDEARRMQSFQYVLK